MGGHCSVNMYLSMANPSAVFLAQDITWCCKDCESSVYKFSGNMMHMFYSHELILPMAKSRNASLNGFTIFP